jgi:photosystem II PsbX protein
MRLSPLPFSLAQKQTNIPKVGIILWINWCASIIDDINKIEHFMTPTLSNFLYSLLFGGLIVVVPATIGLIFISQKDKIQRN